MLTKMLRVLVDRTILPGPGPGPGPGPTPTLIRTVTLEDLCLSRSSQEQLPLELVEVRWEQQH